VFCIPTDEKRDCESLGLDLVDIRFANGAVLLDAPSPWNSGSVARKLPGSDLPALLSSVEILACWPKGWALERPLAIFGPCCLLGLKEVRMGPGSFESNFIIKNLVNQKPVGLDVAVSVADPTASEWMIAVFGWKRFLCKKKVHQRFQFLEVFASLLQALDIFLELICLAEPHFSQEA
jgi:hypothetical protein